MSKRQTQRSKVRYVMIGGLFLVPFLGLTAWFWLSSQSNTDDRLTRVVEDYGYSAVTPPSRLFGPGNIMTVETLSDGTLRLHPACKMNSGTLAEMWNRSPTTNRNLAAAIKQTFESSAQVVDALRSGATGDRFNGMTVSLQNLNIVTMSYEDLHDVRDQYLKGTCEAVVIGNLRAGAEVCQPEEVLEADIVYTRKHQDGLKGRGSVAVAIPADVSANLGHDEWEDDEVQGDDLFLGVKVRLNNCLKLAKNGRGLADANF
jgi:hypothetical protein